MKKTLILVLLAVSLFSAIKFHPPEAAQGFYNTSQSVKM